VLGALAIIIAVLIVMNSRADTRHPQSPAPTVTDTGVPPSSAHRTPAGEAPR